jgi:hypothetical protein
MIKIPPPSEYGLRIPIRKVLGCTSKEPVKVGYFLVKVRGYLLDYHDLYHLEVSFLERIQIGKDMVSGIHGINSPVLHEFPITEEYNEIFDEVRVAMHECLTRPSIFSLFKAIFWFFWLITQGINPITVIVRHIKSMQCYQPEKAWLDHIVFVHPETSSQNYIINTSFLSS